MCDSTRLETMGGPMSPAQDPPLYLDHAATAPPLPQALQAFSAAAAQGYANPGSLHQLGADAARMLEQAREELKRGLGARNYQVIWTGTGTESNHLGIHGLAHAVRNKVARQIARDGGAGTPRILVGAVEHPCSLQAAQALSASGFSVELIPVDRCGVIRPAALQPLLGADVALVSVHWANNELGSLSPIAELAALTRRLAPTAVFHTDAVQAAGKRPESIDSLGAHSVAVAAHKLGGVRGCAALLLHQDSPRPLPTFVGGGHEEGLRSGTENVMGAAAFAAAVSHRRQLLSTDPRRYLQRRQTLLDSLRRAAPDLVVAGGDQERDILGSILSVAIPGTRAESLLHHLEDLGIYCGSGSACSAHGHSESAILQAIDFPQELRNSVLRFSLDGTESAADLERVGASLTRH